MNYRIHRISPVKNDKRLYHYDINEDILKQIKLKIQKEGSLELDFSRGVPCSTMNKLTFIDWIAYILPS